MKAWKREAWNTIRLRVEGYQSEHRLIGQAAHDLLKRGDGFREPRFASGICRGHRGGAVDEQNDGFGGSGANFTRRPCEGENSEKQGQKG